MTAVLIGRTDAINTLLSSEYVCLHRVFFVRACRKTREAFLRLPDGSESRLYSRQIDPLALCSTKTATSSSYHWVEESSGYEKELAKYMSYSLLFDFLYIACEKKCRDKEASIHWSANKHEERFSSRGQQNAGQTRVFFLHRFTWGFACSCFQKLVIEMKMSLKWKNVYNDKQTSVHWPANKNEDRFRPGCRPQILFLIDLHRFSLVRTSDETLKNNFRRILGCKRIGRLLGEQTRRCS